MRHLKTWGRCLTTNNLLATLSRLSRASQARVTCTQASTTSALCKRARVAATQSQTVCLLRRSAARAGVRARCKSALASDLRDKSVPCGTGNSESEERRFELVKTCAEPAAPASAEEQLLILARSLVARRKLPCPGLAQCGAARGSAIASASLSSSPASSSSHRLAAQAQAPPGRPAARPTSCSTFAKLSHQRPAAPVPSQPPSRLALAYATSPAPPVSAIVSHWRTRLAGH